MLKQVLILASTVLFLSPSFAKDKKQCDFEVLEKQVKANLATFDKLDFDFFSKQDWAGFATTHTKDVKVH